MTVLPEPVRAALVRARAAARSRRAVAVVDPGDRRAAGPVAEHVAACGYQLFLAGPADALAMVLDGRADVVLVASVRDLAPYVEVAGKVPARATGSGMQRRPRKVVGPSADDLAAIDAEWPLIEAEIALPDTQRRPRPLR